MVKIQLDLPDDVDKGIKHYMIDNNIDDKREATIKILRKKFKLKDPEKEADEILNRDIAR